jgi:hypothetical protein
MGEIRVNINDRPRTHVDARPETPDPITAIFMVVVVEVLELNKKRWPS